MWVSSPDRRHFLFLPCSQWVLILCSVYYVILKIKDFFLKHPSNPRPLISVNCFCFCLARQLSDQLKSLKHSSAMCCHCLALGLSGNIHNSFNNKTTNFSNNFAQGMPVCACVCVHANKSRLFPIPSPSSSRNVSLSLAPGHVGDIISFSSGVCQSPFVPAQEIFLIGIK